MKIALIGDIHGDTAWWNFLAQTLNDTEVREFIQVGDFGIGKRSGDINVIKRINSLNERYGLTGHIVPGNHENWDYINEAFQGKRDTTWLIQPTMNVLPRGYRWEQEGLSFVALGGAPSVDRAWRVEDQKGILNSDYHLWWAGEMITREDVEYVAEGGYADVMIGHDAPANVPSIERLIEGNPHGFKAADILYAADGRALLTEAWAAVKPRMYVGGHYHPPYGIQDSVPIPDSEGQWCQVTILGCNNQPGALGILDTDTQQIDILPLGKAYREWANTQHGMKGYDLQY